MKNIVKSLAMLVILAMAMATTALAGNSSPREEMRRVTGVKDTRYEGVLIERELRLSCSTNTRQDILVKFNPYGPEWSNVKKVEKGNWLRTVTCPGRKIKIFFDRNFPALGLDGILEE